MPDVLGALEHAEGQARKKVPGGHEASRGPEAEAGGSWKKKQDTHKKKEGRNELLLFSSGFPSACGRIYSGPWNYRVLLFGIADKSKGSLQFQFLCFKRGLGRVSG